MSGKGKLSIKPTKFSYVNPIGYSHGMHMNPMLSRQVMMDPGVAKVAIPGPPSIVSPVLSPVPPVVMNPSIVASSTMSPIPPVINTTITPKATVMSPVANVLPIANSLAPQLVFPINYGLIPNLGPINPLDYKNHDYVRSRFGY